MKTKTTNIVPIVICALFSLGLATTYTSVFADSKIATSTNTKAMNKMIAQSDKEISKRIDSLNSLSTRVEEMRNISVSEKTNIDSQIQTQISNLSVLKSKIDADTDTTTLKDDLKSITEKYRIYALILPEIQIVAASDRLNTIASDIGAIADKLQMRINTEQVAGKNIANIQVTLNNLKNKVTDAQLQASTSINRIVSLSPDQGDKIVMQSNNTALKQSRADIRVGTIDIQVARKDAEIIIKSIRSFHKDTPTTASSSKQ